jgi:CO/xanthine dehydrogenase Mo-binding subunit
MVRAGGRLATGQAIATPHGLEACIEQAWSRAAERPLPRDNGAWTHGRGVACALKNAGYAFGFDDHATARVTLGRDRAEVQIAAADVGQGVATILTQIAAEELNLPATAITLSWRDTAAAPEAGSTSASHQTIVSGNAVRRACARARRAFDDAGRTAHSITVCETYHAPRTDPVGTSEQMMYAFSYSACVADVAVDRETGRVRVLRLVEAVDAGRVLNPALFRGQVEGGAVMGQGYALQETFVVRDGVPLTASLGGCNLPTALDAAPAIEVITVETPDPVGPYGARGIGEVTMLPVVPAITAAIHAATGVWVDALPATPERVLAALDATRDREQRTR